MVQPPSTESKKADREMKRLAKMEEMLKREKERNVKLKSVISTMKAKKAIRRSPGAPRVKRANTAWVMALQQWNKGKGEYKIPKKGSPEYDQVFIIKEQLMKENASAKLAGDNKKQASDNELTLRDDEIDDSPRENIFIEQN